MPKHTAQSQESLFKQQTPETPPVENGDSHEFRLATAETPPIVDRVHLGHYTERHAINRKENIGKEDTLNSFSFPPSSFSSL